MTIPVRKPKPDAPVIDFYDRYRLVLATGSEGLINLFRTQNKDFVHENKWHRDNGRALIIEYGRARGFPECCIKAYVEDLRNGESSEARGVINHPEVGKFVPCWTCWRNG